MADYELRQRWCLAIGAPILLDDGMDPSGLGGYPRVSVARARGEVELNLAAQDQLRRRHAIATRDDLMAWARQRLHGEGERAWELAQLVAVIGTATLAELMTEDDAWEVILVAGKLVQQAYGSWDDLAAGYERGGKRAVSDAARAIWRELPWATELDVTIIDPAARARFSRATCSGCGAPRTRPSPTPYVYCDACGQLVDYDFSVALVERPGPSYERLRAELGPQLAAAREGDDLDAYRAIQRRLVDALVEACPAGLPVRVKDPVYRAGFVAWFAEAETVAAFDALARVTEAAMYAAVGKLMFVDANGRTRVPAEQFRPLAEAYFAYEARRDALYFERGIYDRHPDGASRALQRKVGYSAFVQGWLPMLDEAEGAALLARTGLARDYVIAEPIATHAASCSRCGGPLVLVAGARRVVCDHCGGLVDVVGP